mgnify:CR=1 FL=1
MKFNSQICTSVEQSKRLMELGLKKETADMEIEIFKGDNTISGYVSKGYWENEISDAIVELIPAWSLHRLIETIDYSSNIDAIKELLAAKTMFNDRLYDRVIDIIEHLISNNNFNKDYLEEKV